MNRIYNFYAGPSTLPVEVLEEAAKDLVNYKSEGLSIMETSHRSKMYDNVHTETISLIKELYKVPDNYEILFLQGGASSQFFMAPMNFIRNGKKAEYIITGAWTKKALKEAKILKKNVSVIASSEETTFNFIPKDYTVDNDSEYLYITSNNTIYGTQYKSFPKTNGVPLIIDASSDIFSYPIEDWSNIGMLFAGAQKNAGPSGVTIVIVRKDLIERENDETPTMLKYSTHADSNSLFNTPPTFGIYMIGLVLKWIKGKGGIKAIADQNEMKAKLIYDVIDNSNGFYKGHSEIDSRSLMNITFVLANKDLEPKMVEEATKLNMIGLKGHRSVGGLRASTYNAMTVEGCQKLADFMKDFAERNK